MNYGKIYREKGIALTKEEKEKAEDGYVKSAARMLRERCKISTYTEAWEIVEEYLDTVF